MSKSGITTIDMLVVDWHGCLRSKRLPITLRDKLETGKARLPLSTQAQDFGNDDRDELTGLALSAGDPDGCFVAEQSTLKKQPWNLDGMQVLGSLHELDGRASDFDSRAVLMRQIAKFAERGWRAVVAIELEFYVLDAGTRKSGRPVIPDCLRVAGEPADIQLCEPRAMDRVDGLVSRIHRYAAALDIPAETTLAEIGPGQFEINLNHRDDPLKAADEAILFRRVVDRAAFDEGLLATFMAKPYTEHAGSGQHVHVSVIDADNNNLLDADASPGAVPHGGTTSEGSADSPDPVRLRHAVAGLLGTLEEAQLLYAPNGNSYRRLQPGEFAPTRVDWGLDHRGVAIRLPETTGLGARLEHRVAGADANTYLVLAAVMSGVLQGLTGGREPDSAPVMPGDKPSARHLTHDWIRAIERAEASTFLHELLGDRFLKTYVTIKRHEASQFNRQVTDSDWRACLPRV